MSVQRERSPQEVHLLYIFSNLELKGYTVIEKRDRDTDYNPLEVYIMIPSVEVAQLRRSPLNWNATFLSFVASNKATEAGNAFSGDAEVEVKRRSHYKDHRRVTFRASGNQCQQA